MGPPDYVGVGGPHAGTAWWDRLIQAHPATARAPGFPGSVDHFRGSWREGPGDGPADGPPTASAARYHAWFPRPPGLLAGEWTTTYMLNAWVPPALHRVAPDARVIALLRDPVSRFRAGRGAGEGHRQRGVTARAAANASFGRGLYADQLARLWAAFPRDQVLVLQYERCLADPLAELRRTYAFLGLDPDPAEEVDVGGPEDEPLPTLPGGMLDERQEALLARAYAAENARLAELLPDLDLGLWTSPPARGVRSTGGHRGP